VYLVQTVSVLVLQLLLMTSMVTGDETVRVKLSHSDGTVFIML